jgi:hypothetical protein
MLGSLRTLRALVFATATVVMLLALTKPSAAQIKNPGDHPDYSVELEPHFVFQWDGRYWGDDGIGLGGRVSIPIIKNGPIRTINNSLAIGVGFDWVHFGGNCYGYYFPGPGPGPGPGPAWECDGSEIHIPVVGQWNFYFTPVISLFGEAGFAISHATFDVPCGPGVNNSFCGSWSETDPTFVFAVGPRFQIANAVAITLRLGTPYMSAGVSFFL